MLRSKEREIPLKGGEFEKKSFMKETKKGVQLRKFHYH